MELSRWGGVYSIYCINNADFGNIDTQTNETENLITIGPQQTVHILVCIGNAEVINKCINNDKWEVTKYNNMAYLGV